MSLNKFVDQTSQPLTVVPNAVNALSVDMPFKDGTSSIIVFNVSFIKINKVVVCTIQAKRNFSDDRGTPSGILQNQTLVDSQYRPEIDCISFTNTSPDGQVTNYIGGCLFASNGSIYLILDRSNPATAWGSVGNYMEGITISYKTP